jgi:hypothetical protein
MEQINASDKTATVGVDKSIWKRRRRRRRRRRDFDFRKFEPTSKFLSNKNSQKMLCEIVAGC